MPPAPLLRLTTRFAGGFGLTLIGMVVIPWDGSSRPWSAMTFTVTSIEPIACGWTTTPTVAPEPPMSVPIRAVSVPADSVAVPWLAVAETKVTVARQHVGERHAGGDARAAVLDGERVAQVAPQADRAGIDAHRSPPGRRRAGAVPTALLNAEVLLPGSVAVAV